MSERINHPDILDNSIIDSRKQVADSLRRLRKLEKEGTIYNRNRNGKEYLKEFLGLENTFAYVRKLSSNKVLDIGAGTTLGINQITQWSKGNQLEPEATVLVRDEEINKNLKYEKTHLTSAEALKGIKNESYGCILASCSVAYSKAPQLALQQINRVLVPGGVFKATFQPEDHTGHPGMAYNTDNFTIYLDKMGYQWEKLLNNETHYDVVLAIKPGGPISDINIQDLLKKDQESWQRQALELSTELNLEPSKKSKEIKDFKDQIDSLIIAYTRDFAKAVVIIDKFNQYIVENNSDTLERQSIIEFYQSELATIESELEPAYRNGDIKDEINSIDDLESLKSKLNESIKSLEGIK